MSIITAYVAPPVPTDQWDWMACVAGEEEYGPVGRGATEVAALCDLCEALWEIILDKEQDDGP